MMKHEFTTLGFVLLILLGVCSAYVWGFQEVIKIEGESVALRETITETVRARDRAVKAQSQADAFALQEQELFSHFVQSDDVVTFLSYVETRGQAYNATVSVASVSDTAATGSITLALSIEGSFAAVMQTLAALEHGVFAISAQTITLEKRDEGSWELTGTFAAATETP